MPAEPKAPGPEPMFTGQMRRLPEPPPGRPTLTAPMGRTVLRQTIISAAAMVVVVAARLIRPMRGAAVTADSAEAAVVAAERPLIRSAIPGRAVTAATAG